MIVPVRPFRPALVDAALLPLALLLVLVADVLWRGGRMVLQAIADRPPLRRLQARLGRLPPWVALPLFLVPEGTSRAGFFISAWLVWQGQAESAAILYAGTKLIAGLLALWIYMACEPALLRVRWFRAVHDALRDLRARGQGWLHRRPGALGIRLTRLRRSLAARLPWMR
jgi:hypothetical protein